MEYSTQFNEQLFDYNQKKSSCSALKFLASKIMENNKQTKKRSSLFISSLSPKCTEDDLSKIFSPFGAIASINIKNQISGCESLAFGFVNFLAIKSAVRARNELNGTQLFGETLR